jgi:hypothetical protein
VSNPMNPAAPATRRRPGSVTASSYLLILVAVIQVINMVIALSVAGKMREAYKAAYAGTNMADQAETVASITAIATAVIGVLVAAGLVVLALLNNRGKNPSRIVTWVLGGLFLCCSGVGLAFSAAGNAFGMNNANNGNAPSPAEVQRALDANLPGWYQPVTTTLAAVSLLSLLAALILLALPSSNAFFRRPQPTWEPPAPGSTYPGYPPPGAPGGEPGYPQSYGGQPGYPQSYGGQPGYPQPSGGEPGWQSPGGGSQPPPGSGNPPGS